MLADTARVTNVRIIII